MYCARTLIVRTPPRTRKVGSREGHGLAWVLADEGVAHAADLVVSGDDVLLLTEEGLTGGG